MKCQICQENTDGINDATYISNNHMAKIGREVTKPTTAYDQRVAHFNCIEDPNLLERDSLKRWIDWKVIKQDEVNRELRAAVRRLEDGFLSLPEDMAPELRDQLLHIRQTYGE